MPKDATKKAPRKRKQRARGTSPHPGVVLVSPKGLGDRAAWRAKYTDPDTGRVTWERLNPVKYTNERARLQWAKAKAKALAERRAELARGAVRMTGATVAAEVDRYFEDHPHLRDKTLRTYRDAAAKLVKWCGDHGVRSVDTLDRARLLAFRASLIAEPKHGERKGLARGKAAPTEAKRSAHSVNRELRAVGTVLNYLRKAGRLPRLGTDDIADGLERLRAPREPIAFLRAPEIARLLEAALAHDAEKFEITREEHLGLRPVGTTPRYTPIAPAVFGALATGMRLGELVRVSWKDVDLEAKGEDGKRAGEIVVRGESSKTGIGRVIDLAVSPALRRLLEAMRPDGREALEGPVFGVTYDEATAAGKRLVKAFEAPEGFSWQACRRTAGTFLTNAPGIFGAASAYRSARQLGHSVTVAERNYLGVVRGISPEARTLEAAMGIEKLADRVISAAKARSGKTSDAKVIDLRTRRGRA